MKKFISAFDFSFSLFQFPAHWSVGNLPLSATASLFRSVVFAKTPSKMSDGGGGRTHALVMTMHAKKRVVVKNSHKNKSYIGLDSNTLLL